MMRTWRVWALDSWGNAEDGWTVNDRREVGRVRFDDDGTEDQTVLHVLVSAGILLPGAKLDVSDFDWGPDGYVAIALDSLEGEPLLDLETVDP